MWLLRAHGLVHVCANGAHADPVRAVRRTACVRVGLPPPHTCVTVPAGARCLRGGAVEVPVGDEISARVG